MPDYRKLYLSIIILLMTICAGFAQTSLEGKVIDEETKEAIPFGTVVLYKNGVLVRGTDTDIDGAYSF